MPGEAQQARPTRSAPASFRPRRAASGRPRVARPVPTVSATKMQGQHDGQPVERPGPRQRRANGTARYRPRATRRRETIPSTSPERKTNPSAAVTGPRLPPVSAYSQDDAADVIDDHREDAEAAQQVQTRVAPDRRGNEPPRQQHPIERANGGTGGPGRAGCDGDGHDDLDPLRTPEGRLSQEYEENLKKERRTCPQM